MTSRFMTPGLQGLALALALVLPGCNTIGDFFGGGGGDSVDIEGERERVLAAEEGLTADPEASNRSIALGSPQPMANWPQLRALPDKQLGHLRVGGLDRRVWEIDLGEGDKRTARIVTPPVVHDGVIYALNSASVIHAVDADTGERLWRAPISGTEEVETVEGLFSFRWRRWLPGSDDNAGEVGFGGGLAHDGERLILTSGFGFVAGIDPLSGEELWRTTTPVPIRSAPTVREGRAYIQTIANTTLALDTTDGTVIWTHQGVEEPARLLTGASPAVTDDLVLVGYGTGELVALDPDDGRVLWSAALALAGRMAAIAALNDIAGSPVVHRGVVLVANRPGRSTAIEARTGQRLWTLTSGSVHPLTAEADSVFLLTTENKLAAVSLDDGAVIWTTDLPRYEDPEDREDPILWTSPFLINGQLVAFSDRGERIAVNPQTGDIISRRETGRDIRIDPVVAGDTLYTLDREARLTAWR